MATRKTKDLDMLADIASELGISPAKLESMSIDEIRDVIRSGDLDPALKAKLVRSKLKAAADALDLAAVVIEDSAEDEAPRRGGKNSRTSYRDAAE